MEYPLFQGYLANHNEIIYFTGFSPKLPMKIEKALRIFLQVASLKWPTCAGEQNVVDLSQNMFRQRR